jgi:serine/threonine protein kinase
MSIATTCIRSLSADLADGPASIVERISREVLKGRLLGKHRQAVFVGPYVLEAKVGNGSMGYVFKARHVVTGHLVALKVLRGNIDDEVRRFEREAGMLSRLRNPHLVEYVDHGTSDDGLRYIAMEWLEGADLAEVMEDGPLSIHEALTIALGVARGLAGAHQAGIVHRDIKPSNIFLVDRDPTRVKILDFGLVRRGRADDRITGAGVRVGTPAYMAMEQHLGRAHLTPTVDVYALGVVLFECLCGERPFKGRSLGQLVRSAFHDARPSIAERVYGLPVMLDGLITSMLAKDADERPPHAGAVAQMLERYVG